MNNKLSTPLLILIGLVAHGFFLAYAIPRFKKEDRSISVKGFAEKEVKANQAMWTIKTQIAAEILTEGSRQVEVSKAKTLEFLLKNGIKKEEIIQKDLNVKDKLAQEYGGGYQVGPRYFIENSIQVRTSDVDKVQALSRRTDELLKMGTTISSTNDYRPAVQYLYTGLNDIKPQMLSEATTNARKAAEEFTKDGKVSLGKLKRASQGLFTIVDRDESAAAGTEGGYASSVNDMYKKVRVVISVEYSID